MTTITTKNVRVYDLCLIDDTNILFEFRDEELDNRVAAVAIFHDQWKELGKPTAITVTIEPGDHLNV